MTDNIVSLGDAEAADSAAHNISHSSDNRVYVGNLSWSHTEDSVRELFSGFGIADIFFPGKKPRPNGFYHQGYCFIGLSSEEEVALICERFNGQDDGRGRKLVVRPADPRTSKRSEYKQRVYDKKFNKHNAPYRDRKFRKSFRHPGKFHKRHKNYGHKHRYSDEYGHGGDE